MNIKPDNAQQSISDDQELAKVLAGVNGQGQTDGGQESTLPEPAVPPTPMPTADEVAAPSEDAPADAQPPVEPPQPPQPEAPAPAVGGDLDGIKQQALGELRPLVDKLDVDPQEKFDTYLLLLRSTDDKELIAPAHEAAKAIADESRRAQALLNIIKEIDFLSGATPQA